MIANNNRKSYRSYLNELVDQCNILIIFYIGKKNLLILIILLRLKKMRPLLKLLNLDFMIESELLSTRILLVKVILKIGH